MKPSPFPEAAFLAAMTASATHEVRNVLAIIKESAGLIQDLVLVGGKRGKVDEEKINRAVDRIETQVKRGADLLTNLNRLSHTLDEARSTVELNQEIEQVVFLSQRFARKKGHHVLARDKRDDCYATVSPLHLQMVLFTAISCCLEELPEGSTVTVGVRRGEGGSVVEYAGSMGEGGALPSDRPGEWWPRLEELARALGSGAERFESGYGIRIVFHEGTGG